MRNYPKATDFKNGVGFYILVCNMYLFYLYFLERLKFTKKECVKSITRTIFASLYQLNFPKRSSFITAQIFLYAPAGNFGFMSKNIPNIFLLVLNREL